MQNLIFITLSIIAFSLPFFNEQKIYNIKSFKGWDKTFNGKLLKEIPLNENEKKFLIDFPGKINKFTDGERQIIMRYIENPTRKLHSSSDCYKGIGYKIKYEPIEIDKDKIKWSSFIVKKGDKKLKIKERIYKQGKNWTDVSSWYWENIFNKNTLPSIAVTIIEPI